MNKSMTKKQLTKGKLARLEKIAQKSKLTQEDVDSIAALVKKDMADEFLGR